MNVGLLDHLNRDNALHNIARCGGLIALVQLQQFLKCHKSSAYRSAGALERERMCTIIKPAGFLILSRPVAGALGADLPVPPHPNQLRASRVRDCIGRAAYFLKSGWASASMGDLSGRWKTEHTKQRISKLITRQLRVWHSEARQLHAQYQREQSDAIRSRYQELRRKIREPGTILSAGMAALQYFRGLYLVTEAPDVRFVFFDRGTRAARLKALVQSLRRFSAATALDVTLDIVCGNERAQQRVTQILAQTETRLTVNILDLNYEHFIHANAEPQPALITHELKPLSALVEEAAQ